MNILLDRRGSDALIIEDVVQAAGKYCMTASIKIPKCALLLTPKITLNTWLSSSSFAVEQSHR